jgi:citrate synthase
VTDVQSGLEGVVAFATEIAEPDREGGALRYRGVDKRSRPAERPAARGSADVAEALERAALAELRARKPDRVLATSVEFWSAVVLDLAAVPPKLFTSMSTCARVAGRSAHILEQKREGRLIRPTAKYVGAALRSAREVERLRPRHAASS